MDSERRARFIRRYIDKWAAADYGSAAEKKFKEIALLLAYGASVRTINRHSHERFTCPASSRLALAAA